MDQNTGGRERGIGQKGVWAAAKKNWFLSKKKL